MVLAKIKRMFGFLVRKMMLVIYVIIFILALKKQIIEISVVVKRYWVTLFSEVGLGRKEAGCMLLCLVYLCLILLS